VKVFVVDPSLYTSPYDEHFMQGLLETGVEPVLFTRPFRPGEQLDLPAEAIRPFFYRSTDWRAPLLGKAAKGVEHLLDQARFARAVADERPDVIHFQWSVMPLFDKELFRKLRRRCPVVLTAHDTKAFNGAQTSRLQTLGFNDIFQAASHVIVHTASAAETLQSRGVPEGHVSIIPHGPLTLKARPAARRRSTRSAGWTVVAFGRLRPYKGLSVLVDAVSLLPEGLRAGLRCIVAGEAMMDLAPLVSQIEAAGLQSCFDLRPRQHTDDEVSDLLEEADCFVFPYLDIEASGVLFLVGGLGRWMIASDLGAFREVIVPGVSGDLVPPGDAAQLSAALARSIETRPHPQPAAQPISWKEIGGRTVALYRSLLSVR